MHGFKQQGKGVLVKAERPLEASQVFVLTFAAPGGHHSGAIVGRWLLLAHRCVLGLGAISAAQPTQALEARAQLLPNRHAAKLRVEGLLLSHESTLLSS